MDYDLVIGLEVHAQLNTRSKLFSGSSTQYGAASNTQCSYVDAALPGTLPVMNHQALVKAIQFGLAIKADINTHSWFERKNYFYPDLPKGYQISQFQSPVVQNGFIDIQLSTQAFKRIIIERAHLEEDAGKSVHDVDPIHTGIDLNRAGTPLLEIVTSPCLSSAEEVITYLKDLHQLVRFLDICDGNMQEGSFRCDVNISLKPKGSTTLGTRTELKNLNSFKFIEQAIAYESLRHKKLLDSGKSIVQETRLYDPDANCTRSMRSKENENDYRYFPDPDLLPIVIDETTLNSIKANMPSLPADIKAQLQQVTSLTEEDIQFILASPEHYLWYENIRKNLSGEEKLIINWLKGPFSALINEVDLSFKQSPVPMVSLTELLSAISQKTLTISAAKQVMKAFVESGQEMRALINDVVKDSIQDHGELQAMVARCIAQNPEQVAQFMAGKTKLLGFFVGQIMKQAKGTVDPGIISTMVLELLNARD